MTAPMILQWTCVVNDDTVAIRYAVITQLLGKMADPSRDILAIQASGGWDARSFAKRVVVPWVIDNRNILGTSMEPYVGKPLRRERLDSPASFEKTRNLERLGGVLEASRFCKPRRVGRCLAAMSGEHSPQGTQAECHFRVSRTCQLGAPVRDGV